MSDSLSSTFLSLLTPYELSLIERRMWSRITEGAGYQPFGFDRPTTRITHPSELAALAALAAVRSELLKRNPSTSLPRRSNVT